MRLWILYLKVEMQIGEKNRNNETSMMRFRACFKCIAQSQGIGDCKTVTSLILEENYDQYRSRNFLVPNFLCILLNFDCYCARNSLN